MELVGEGAHRAVNLHAFVDFCKRNINETTNLLDAHAHPNSLHLEVWQDAVNYAYDRLLPVQNELRIVVNQCRPSIMVNLAFETRDAYFATQHVPTLDGQWLLHAPEVDMRDRLVQYNVARWSRTAVLELLEQVRKPRYIMQIVAVDLRAAAEQDYEHNMEMFRDVSIGPAERGDPGSQQ